MFCMQKTSRSMPQQAGDGRSIGQLVGGCDAPLSCLSVTVELCVGEAEEEG